MIQRHFASMTLENWRQFSKISIEFHPKLTILTGSNGSGKSTLLRILAQHFGWQAMMLATPRTDKSGGTRYWARVSRKDQEDMSDVIGEIGYSDGNRSLLRVPVSSNAQYQVNFDALQQVLGLNISSHRHVPAYQAVPNIPTNPLRPTTAYSSYVQEIMTRYMGGNTGLSPMYRMKEALISMATFGPGNQNVAPNEELNQTFNGFIEILKKLLPKSIGFLGISVRLPDVILSTESGDFVIDASSGGIMSLIDLAWQIYLFSIDKEEFVVLLDEPENHLHPSMQREILTSLNAAFPSVQFIVATHSPFIVSSVRESRVFVLRNDTENIAQGVTSTALEQVGKAGTANEILRDVLGVPVTLPLWAESDLSTITDDFLGRDISRDLLAELRARLRDAGLSEYYSMALNEIVERQ